MFRFVPSVQRAFSTGPAHGVNKLGVLGAGQMGLGIALTAAMEAKVDVTLVDRNEDVVAKALSFADKLLTRNVSKGKMTEEDASAARSRLQAANSVDAFAESDFVIEAVSEDTELKKNLFRQLEEVTRPEVILGTNTSSISITKVASAVSRPDKVIGMHFFNPVPVMKIVEIINGLQTSEETINRTVALAQAMGKTTTRAKDMPGFIANRILMPYINEAAYALNEGIGTVQDIDTTMKLGTNVPMGPLTLADFIGLDTCLAIMRVLHNELGDTKYRPCPLLVKYVDAGYMGRKSGRGFYSYE